MWGSNVRQGRYLKLQSRGPVSGQQSAASPVMSYTILFTNESFEAFWHWSFVFKHRENRRNICRNRTARHIPQCAWVLVAWRVSGIFKKKGHWKGHFCSILLIHWVQVTSVFYREETRHHRSGWRSGRRTTPSSRMCTTCATTRWQSGSRTWKRWPRDLADNCHKVTSGLFQAISRIMADKVYTSAEFKRERDSFHVSTKHLVCKYNRVQRTTQFGL